MMRPHVGRLKKRALFIGMMSALLLPPVFISGCSYLLSGTSAGGYSGHSYDYYKYEIDRQLNTAIVEYSNTIDFSRDLTISVDSVFARMKARDRDVDRALDDMMQPAERFLENAYGLHMPPWSFEAVPAERKIRLQAPNPKGRHATLGNQDSRLTAIVRNRNRKEQFEWFCEVIDAEAQFSSLIPQRVSIRAKLAITVARIDDKQQRVMSVEYDDAAVARLSDDIRRKLNRIYSGYLKNAYGLEVTTAATGESDAH